jgi:hypothetical protein
VLACSCRGSTSSLSGRPSGRLRLAPPPLQPAAGQPRAGAWAHFSREVGWVLLVVRLANCRLAADGSHGLYVRGWGGQELCVRRVMPSTLRAALASCQQATTASFVALVRTAPVDSILLLCVLFVQARSTRPGTPPPPCWPSLVTPCTPPLCLSRRAARCC